MPGKPSNKCLLFEGHEAFFPTLPIVFVGKRNCLWSQVDDPVVGDGDLVGVPAKVFNHLFGTPKGSFGIDDLFLGKEGFEELGCKWYLFLLGLFSQGFGKLSPKNLAHGFYRKKEFAFATGHFPSSRLGQPTAGHNAVQVGMEREVLAPCMENGDHGRLRAEMLMVAGKSLHSLPGDPEEQAIDHPGMTHGQGIELMRQGKNHMKIGNREEFFLPGCDPLLPLCALTLGTMAIPAAVIADTYMTAAGTGIEMSPQCSGSALGQCLEHSFLMITQPA